MFDLLMINQPTLHREIRYMDICAAMKYYNITMKNNLTIDEVTAENIKLKQQIEQLKTKNGELNQLNKNYLELKQRVEIAFDGTGIGLWETNLMTGEMKVNRNWSAMLGYEDQTERDHFKAWERLVHPDDKVLIFDFFETSVSEENKVFELEYRMRAKDGSWRWFSDRGCIIELSESGKPLRVIGTNRDISRQKDAEERLRRMAMYDVLTGLPNRRFCEDLLTREIALARRNDFKLAVVFLDLDDFKTVNDEHGHDIGDLLLKQVAGRMLTSIRDSDTVARLGGDEFLIVLQGQHQQKFKEILERLMRLLSAPFDLNGIIVDTKCSLGVSVFPDDADNMNDLLQRADAAMYQVKNSGKNNYKFS